MSSILRPDPVYKFSITLQKVAMNILICYLLVGFIEVADLIFGFMDNNNCFSLVAVPLISGAATALTNIVKQSIRKE
jgi:hypothetical protein